MLFAARLVSDLVYAFGGTVLSFVICNAVGPCPKTNNILEIYSASFKDENELIYIKASIMLNSYSFERKEIFICGRQSYIRNVNPNV